MTNQSSPENEPDELLNAAMDDMRDPEVASALRAEQAQQPAYPVNDERERMATRLDEHAIRYANDYGYNVATDLKRAAEMLRRPAQCAPAPYGKHRVEHEGMTLECNYFVPGLTLHDLTMIYERASKSEGVSEYAGNPSDWPVVRGVKAVAEACIEALSVTSTDSGGT